MASASTDLPRNYTLHLSGAIVWAVVAADARSFVPRAPHSVPLREPAKQEQWLGA